MVRSQSTTRRAPAVLLYEELKHIRTIFKALGLDAYLR